ncbi:ATP-dependent helicase C-terminal domain-containing protein [Corynebacterium kozikiae]|uniref:ATP-dependent helicase C-terminal domain-containing protein n=1 Tax=Corynebacterium kozikiae TaxID=2968469 RepID=UPI00211BEA7A|nr:helicase-related protein [Corynebacterium sp. 76QC2CO]
MRFDVERIGHGLPVLAQADAWAAALQERGCLVIEAPPGTGKTTLAPAVVANQVRGTTVVVAPRRVAVRAAARRLRQLSGAPEAVGVSIRGEHTPGNQVEFVTPGVLLRRLLTDPELAGVDAVIVDEVHERQVDTDLLLGMLIELRELRPELLLVAMSATVDTVRFAELLGGGGDSPDQIPAPVVRTEAALHPLSIHYEPLAGRFPLTRDYAAGLARIAKRELAALPDGQAVLVFVPGVRDVEVLCQLIGADARPLHGRLESSIQDEAFQGGSRIVVATAIAESSLTVPGVRVVVDAGLARTPKRDVARGVQGLVTVSASKAAADQRAGRAGREGPGKVVRCYREEEYQHFQPDITPEIASADLTFAALALSCWGTPWAKGFPLLSPPSTAALHQAYTTLAALGACTDSGEATAFGRELVTLPVDPRLGAALLRCGSQAAWTVTALSEEVPGTLTGARSGSPGVGSPGAPGTQGQAAYSNRADLSKQARRLAALVNDLGPVSAGVVVGSAYPDFIARNVSKDAKQHIYLSASGTRIEVPFSHGEPWYAVGAARNSGNTTGGGGGSAHTIRAINGAPISESEALELIGVHETHEAWVEEGRMRAVRVKKAGNIELSRTPTSVSATDLGLSEDELTRALMEHQRNNPNTPLLTPEPEARHLLERLAFLNKHVGEPWPNTSPRKLAQQLDWLEPEFRQVARGEKAAGIALLPAVQRLLPWPEAARLDNLAPPSITVPSGRAVRVDYSGEQPTLAVKLQECFGLAASPEIVGVPVLFHLLSPAGRPLAVTADLASFWASGYQAVRAEMRGRYPKHPWPEDPTTAQATARTNTRRA